MAALAARLSLGRAAQRSLQVAVLVGASLVALATRASAQDAVPNASGSAFEIRPYVGAYIPTGDQRNLLQDAVLVGAQASYRILPQLAMTGTFGWSPSEDRLSGGNPRLDLFQYDVGAEARGAGWLRGATWDFSPFVGLGVGGRTYSYRDLDVDSSTNLVGYAALGGDLNFGRIGLRLEARDYVSRFEPLIGEGDAEARNDVTLGAGLNVRF